MSKTPQIPVVVKRKPKVVRALKKREPQLVENTKKALILRGHHTSQVIIDVLGDISKLSKPNCKVLSRKNEVLPFEDVNSIEFLSTKNDTSLFALGSHSKKRPNNLVLGRTYDGHLLDMIEFGVTSHQSIESFEGHKKAVGSKPVFVFSGDQWDSDSTFGRIQNLLMDFFRGDRPEKISLKGLDHVISCTVSEGTIHIRSYSIGFMKSGTKVPKVGLKPMGPFLDLSVRRTQLASADLWKVACKKPKSLKPSKIKNISSSSLGDKVGRIHMKKQNLDKMDTRRVSALSGRGKRAAGGDDGEAANGDNDQAKTKKRPRSA